MSLRGGLTKTLVRRRRARIYLHIGAMKTGTTYLQDLMSANKEQLAAAGFLFPGTRWADQSRAAREVLGFSTDDPVMAAQMSGRWSRIREEMLSYRGTACIYSMEFLSFADVEQATRVVESLAPAELHVILTVRDASATIPAQWQTNCRNAGTLPWRKFVKGVRQTLRSGGPPEGKGARMFQRTQGIPRMLEVWCPLVGPENVHVITVPPRGSDPDLLWKRFAGVVGVAPDVCSEPVENTNPSLGHPSTELLRLVNKELVGIPRSDYDRVVKRQLARYILGSRSSAETPVRLGRKGRVLAARWNRRTRRAIRASGVDVVGRLSDLPIRMPDGSGPKALRKPSAAQLLEAACTGRDGLLVHREVLVETADQRYDEYELPPPTVVPSTPITTADRWAAEREPVKAAVRELADLARECIELSRRPPAEVGATEHPEADQPAGL